MTARSCDDWPHLMELAPELQFKHYRASEVGLPTTSLIQLSDLALADVDVCCDLEHHVFNARPHRPADRGGARRHRLAGAPRVDDAGPDELIDFDAATLAEIARPGFVAGLELAEALLRARSSSRSSTTGCPASPTAPRSSAPAQRCSASTRPSRPTTTGGRGSSSSSSRTTSIATARRSTSCCATSCPLEFRGFSTQLRAAGRARRPPARRRRTSGPVDHMVAVTTLPALRDGAPRLRPGRRAHAARTGSSRRSSACSR